MRKLKIFDTTLRDGEQSAGVNLNQVEKLEIARQLERLGVDIMEAGFPASSRGDFLAVEQIAKEIRNASITGLSRANPKDIESSWEALKGAEEPRIHIFLATSPIHMTYKLRLTPDEVIEQAVAAVTLARKTFPHVQFSAEDATRSDKAFLAEIIEKVIQAGATVINLPDTVGYSTPLEYAELFKFVKKTVPSIDRVSLSAHCHDDLGLAVANSLAAIQAGADQVEGTINGIGERAGNASLEEIAVALHIREDFYERISAGLTLNELMKTSQLVSKLTGMVVPANKAIVGNNAFAHESGIHQDGVLKEKSTYEIISPELVGISSNRLVLGKHSGRHAFKEKVIDLGYDLSKEELNAVFQSFKTLTEKKKEITDADIFSLVTNTRTESDDHEYRLLGVQVQYGTHHMPTAAVAVETREGKRLEEAATGQGSVEALYNALEKLFPEPVHLTDYKLHSIGSGRDATAEAYVSIDVNGTKVGGRGTGQDVLEASASAYLNAVNRMARRNEKQKQQVGI